MLRLAAAEADGVILNWLAVEDLPQIRRELDGAKPDFEVVARLFVCPTEDEAYARETGRRLIAGYLTVPAYAAFHRWLGREPRLGEMWRAWAAGDRRAAAASVPDDVIDALVVHGSPASCRAHLLRYAEAGIGTPVIALVPTPELTSGGADALTHVLAVLGGETG
jgi:alkanesulfonate monooxygenase SsuD/methylene tetrahydromethanopterin reductase-like flavin-dependent oxidoreductase (luciferase family)